DQQLTDDVESSGADREPRADLAEAQTRTYESEVREIDDADEDHDERRSPHEQKWCPHIARQRVLQRLDAGVEPGVEEDRLELGRGPFQVARVECLQLIARLFNRCPVFQAAEAVPAVAVAGIVRALPIGEGE